MIMTFAVFRVSHRGVFCFLSTMKTLVIQFGKHFHSEMDTRIQESFITMTGSLTVDFMEVISFRCTFGFVALTYILWPDDFGLVTYNERYLWLTVLFSLLQSLRFKMGQI